MQQSAAIGSASPLQPPLFTNSGPSVHHEDVFTTVSVGAAPSGDGGVAEAQALRLNKARKREAAERANAGAVEDVVLLSTLLFWGLIHAAFLLQP